MRGQSLLAPDEERRAIDALRFSLASEIVELVVLSTDEPFLRTLREAIGPARRLWHVPAPDQVSDLLLAGGVGIFVLDVQALPGAGSLFVTEIKRQFPDLVIVVAGARDAETDVARLISDGTVFRFIHKPVSPARARLFAEAAVKRHDELRQRTAGLAAPSGARLSGRSGLTIAVACAAMGALSAGLWIMVTRGARQASTQAARPAAPAAPAPAPSPADGLTPAAPSPEPDLLARAQSALLEERLGDAAAAIDAARKARADGARLSYLSAQLALARAERKADADRSHRAPADTAPHDTAPHDTAPQDTRTAEGNDAGSPAPQALKTDPHADGVSHGSEAPALDARTADAARLLASAQERLREDRLVAPESDSAKYYLLALRHLDPSNAGLGAATQDLGARLLARSRDALAEGQPDAARGWLDEAAAIGYSSAESLDLRRGVDAALARQRFLANVIDASRLELESSVRPEYPQKARDAGIEGWVELDFTVSVAGGVQDLAVHAASPPGVFDEPAMRALSAWRYKPVQLDGKPVPQRARIRIRFALAR